MALFALSQLTTQLTAANATWEVRSTSLNKPRIMEIGLSNNAATAGTFGVGRPAAIGVTPTSPQTFVDEGDGNAPAALSTAALAWGTGPTVPTNFNRRIGLAATVGVGAIFTYPRGFVLPISGSFVVWVIATGGALNVWAVADE